MTFSESRSNVFAAFVKAQAEIKNPIKNQVNKGVQGAPMYANLEDTLADYVRPVLTKYGLAVTQDIISGESGNVVGVQTYIIHESGEWMESSVLSCQIVIPLRQDGKKILTEGQATGVNITYLRRYSLNAMLGINGDKDTDGSYGEIVKEPMTYERALDYEITFGKHNGKTLRELYKIDRNYIEWLAGNEKTDAEIKEAISLINAEIAKMNAKKGEKNNADTERADQPSSD